MGSNLKIDHEKLLQADGGSDRVKTYLKKILTFEGFIWKCAYLGSVVAGLWLILAFTWYSQVPFPQPDTSFLIFLALISLICSVFLFIIVGMLFMPLLTVAIDKESRKFLVQNETVPIFSSHGICAFFGRYVTSYAPFIVGFLFLLVAVLIQDTILSFNYWKASDATVVFLWTLAALSTLGFLLGIFASAGIFSRWYYRSDDSSVSKRSCVAKFAVSALFHSVIFYVYWAIPSLAYALQYAIKSHIVQRDVGVVPIALVIILILIWHFVLILMAVQRKALYSALLILVSIVALLLYFGSQLGGAALRAFGLGGGTPISLVAKVIEPGSTKVKALHINGCLVLWIGSQITIQRPKDSAETIQPCHLNPLTPVIMKDPATGHEKLVETIIDTITRAEVLDIFAIRQVR